MSHQSPFMAQEFIQPYLYKTYEWATTNNLQTNLDKTTITLFTPDQLNIAEIYHLN